MAQDTAAKSPIRTVCIIGDNSLSTAITKALLSSNLHIHLISQSHHDTPLSNPNLTNHINPLKSTATLTPLLSSLSPPADLLISTSHGGDTALQTLLLTSTLAAQIPRFIPAEFSHDSTNPRIQNLLLPHAARAAFLTQLRTKADDGAIEWIGLATGYDLQSRLRDGNMGIDITWQSATVFGRGDEESFSSSPEFVGAAVAAVVARWDGFAGRYLRVAGLRTSSEGVIAELERQTGKEFEIGRVEREEGVQEARKRIEGGWPDAGMFLLERSVLADEECFEGFVADEGLREELDLEEQRLEEVIKSVLHDLKHHGKGGCGCG